jgi:hypothetical protein
MPAHKPYDEPTKTTAIEGEVVLNGPDSVAVSMTPDAAEKTARRLHRSSQVAARQKRKPSTN